jgi:hypothetical protein
MLTRAAEEFGHRFGMLAVGLDVSSRTGAHLVLDPRFWSAGWRTGVTYNWAWELLPFLTNASAPCRSRQVFKSTEEYLEWALLDARPRSCCEGEACAELNAGIGTSCYHGWCTQNFEGRWDRAGERLARLLDGGGARRHPELEPPERSTDRPASVIWHLRTGDNLCTPMQLCCAT